MVAIYTEKYLGAPEKRRMCDCLCVCRDPVMFLCTQVNQLGTKAGENILHELETFVRRSVPYDNLGVTTHQLTVHSFVTDEQTKGCPAGLTVGPCKE